MLQIRKVTKAAFMLAMTAGLAVSVFPSGATPASATNNAGKPTIVLVHGAFADASGWSSVIQQLERDGYNVVAPSNPLRSLSSDAAYIKSVLDSTSGPLVVVAHSYGGAVITNAAAGNPNVKALVYIDGFIPDVGEDGLHLAGEASRVATSIEPRPFPPFGPNDLDFYIRQDVFHEVFAGDVDETTAAVMWAAQRPIAAASFAEPTTAAAWKSIPSWALIGRQDRVIAPESLRFMANRAGSTVVEIDSSHVSMISHPSVATELIKKAAAATEAAGATE